MFGDGFNLGRLRGELDRLFGTYLGDLEAWRPRDAGGSPAVNLWEDESAFHAEAEVPGLRMEDLEVQVIGNELVITGTRKAEERSNVTYHREERGAGRFGRVIRLPAEVDAGKVQAMLRDGILTITLPKAETARPRKIDVKYAAKS